MSQFPSEPSSQSPRSSLSAPQSPSTEVTGRADFTELLVLINHTRKAFWTFALYNTVPACEEAVDAITRQVAPLPVFEWTWTPENPYPLSYLNKLTETQREQRAVVFFFDLERAGEEIWKSLDYNRESFASHPHALIFWVTSNGRVKAARQAPHFWAQRSSTYDFTITLPERQAELRGEWVGRPLGIESYDDAVRQLRLYQGLLDEYLSQPETPAPTLLDLHSKTARLLAYLDRREEALPYLEAQLALAEQTGDRNAQAEAITNLAEVEAIRTGKPKAVELLTRALELTSNPSLRAGIEFNLGSFLYTQGEADRSEAYLHSALTLYTQVGDKLGQANVLQAIGDVQSFRKEMDAALRSYDEARALFTQVGAKLGQANVRLSVGIMNDDAEAFSQAIALYETIGDTYSIALGRYYFALSLLKTENIEQAKTLLHEAREGWLKINYEPGVKDIDQKLGELNEA